MYTKQHKALTLIEMLIAIGVFAVGVLAVLQLVTNNIKTVHRVSNHMDATMLATQWLELAYEIRNTNSYKEFNDAWDCFGPQTTLTNDANDNGCVEWKQFRSLIDKQWLIIAPAWPDSNTYRTTSTTELPGDVDTLSEIPPAMRLYRHTTDNLTRYNHNASDGETTQYGRYLSFETLEWYDTAKVFAIHSHVLIDEWSRIKDVTISSAIGKIID